MSDESDTPDIEDILISMEDEEIDMSGFDIEVEQSDLGRALQNGLGLMQERMVRFSRLDEETISNISQYMGCDLRASESDEELRERLLEQVDYPSVREQMSYMDYFDDDGEDLSNSQQEIELSSVDSVDSIDGIEELYRNSTLLDEGINDVRKRLFYNLTGLGNYIRRNLTFNFRLNNLNQTEDGTADVLDSRAIINPMSEILPDNLQYKDLPGPSIVVASARNILEGSSQSRGVQVYTDIALSDEVSLGDNEMLHPTFINKAREVVDIKIKVTIVSPQIVSVKRTVTLGEVLEVGERPDNTDTDIDLSDNNVLTREDINESSEEWRPQLVSIEMDWTLESNEQEEDACCHIADNEEDGEYNLEDFYNEHLRPGQSIQGVRELIFRSLTGLGDYHRLGLPNVEVSPFYNRMYTNNDSIRLSNMIDSSGQNVTDDIRYSDLREPEEAENFVENYLSNYSGIEIETEFIMTLGANSSLHFGERLSHNDIDYAREVSDINIDILLVNNTLSVRRLIVLGNSIDDNNNNEEVENDMEFTIDGVEFNEKGDRLSPDLTVLTDKFKDYFDICSVTTYNNDKEQVIRIDVSSDINDFHEEDFDLEASFMLEESGYKGMVRVRLFDKNNEELFNRLI